MVWLTFSSFWVCYGRFRIVCMHFGQFVSVDGCQAFLVNSTNVHEHPRTFLARPRTSTNVHARPRTFWPAPRTSSNILERFFRKLRVWSNCWVLSRVWPNFDKFYGNWYKTVMEGAIISKTWRICSTEACPRWQAGLEIEVWHAWLNLAGDIGWPDVLSSFCLPSCKEWANTTPKHESTCE